MYIHGLQKMTLLDFPGRVACTVFLAGCNLRCPFCHNSELIPMTAEPIMDDKELIEFLKKRKGLLDGVAFTGGEPLMTPGVSDLFARIRDLGYPIKLDTNGCFPDRLRSVVDAGLIEYVAMDIKNSPERYAETSGLPKLDLAPIRESVHFLLDNFVDYEFRTTVVNELHHEDDFVTIGEWIDGAKQYYLQAFKDRDSVIFEGFSAPSETQMSRFAQIVRPHVGKVEIRGL